MKREWVRTADQSQTLWVPELQQHYHSHHGALQESRHVLLRPAWLSLPLLRKSIYWKLVWAPG